jgi:hypothetical protein
MLSIYHDNADFSLEQMNVPPQLPYELRVTKIYPKQSSFFPILAAHVVLNRTQSRLLSCVD